MVSCKHLVFHHQPRTGNQRYETWWQRRRNRTHAIEYITFATRHCVIIEIIWIN